ncbi:MAG: hypothetical protein KF691_12865 [Phycisphaeraceae bacterium]|nr:hypothetical protein [Phycisphaeraceae bacterium]
MKTNRQVSILRLFAMGVFSFLIMGCENKLTRDNYEKIQVGMTVDQVTAILGPGEKITEGGASKLAKDMLGDITFAQQRQNQNQIKQGLGDLTGQAANRDKQIQREAEGNPAPVPAGSPGARSVAAASGKSASVLAAAPVVASRPPVRDRWIWKTDGIEITVDFSDDIVTTKNQDGL